MEQQTECNEVCCDISSKIVHSKCRGRKPRLLPDPVTVHYDSDVSAIFHVAIAQFLRGSSFKLVDC